MIGKKTDPAAIVVALTGGAFRVGKDRYFFHSGQRLRADHPVVRAMPHLFAPDGLDDLELQAARRAIQGTAA